MITAITGALNRVLDEEVRLQVGPFEYAVLVPEFVRRAAPDAARRGADAAHACSTSKATRCPTAWCRGWSGSRPRTTWRSSSLLCTVDKVGVREGAQGAGPAAAGGRRRHPAAGREVAVDAARGSARRRPRR